MLGVPVNVVYCGPATGDEWTIGKPFFERLARATGGAFMVVR